MRLIIVFSFLVHVTFCFTNIKQTSTNIVSVTIGDSITLNCPAKPAGDVEITTWETSAGVFLGIGEKFRVPQITEESVYYCRRRSFREGTMSVGKVLVQLREMIDHQAVTSKPASSIELEYLELKLTIGDTISVTCLPLSTDPRDIEIVWIAPDKSQLSKSDFLQKKVRYRKDFGEYRCQAISKTGTRWHRRIQVISKKAKKSANTLQNDWRPEWLGGKKSTSKPLLTTVSSSSSGIKDFLTTTTTIRPATETTSKSQIIMDFIEMPLAKGIDQTVYCPDPGPVGKHPDFKEFRIFWVRSDDQRRVAQGEKLFLKSSQLFGTYECVRLQKNRKGLLREIRIPMKIIAITMTTSEPSTSTTSKHGANEKPKIYELSPQTIKVLPNETVMLACPDDTSISTTTRFTSQRQIWRDSKRIIGNEKSIFISTGMRTKSERYSCQHDYLDEKGRVVSLVKDYILRLASDQIEASSGENQNIFFMRGKVLRLLCVPDETDGDNFEWIHPSGHPVSSSNLLIFPVRYDSDFGEYKCTAWRAKGPPSLTRTVRVIEKFVPKTKTQYVKPEQPLTDNRIPEEFIALRLNEWLNVQCRNISEGNTFEWIDPNTFEIAQTNWLRRQMTDVTDFGHYTCFANKGTSRVFTRHVNVVQTGETVSDDPTPKDVTARMRRFEAKNFRCVQSSKPGYIYEWIDPNGYVVSKTNVLRVQMMGNSDFGHYECRAFSDKGVLYGRNLHIVEDNSIEEIVIEPSRSITLLCVANPPKDTVFEWMDSEGYVLSKTNYLILNPSTKYKVGKVTCRAFGATGLVGKREVVIVLKPYQIFTTPENGVLKACVGQASASALCWIENQVVTPVWRDHMFNGFKMKTSVLRGRKSRLVLRNVDGKDNGRSFDCYDDRTGLNKTITLKVEECDTCVCLPHEVQCAVVDNETPNKRCISVNWMCDGEDDCGNGFDELNCPAKNDKDDNFCQGTTKTCKGSKKSIPKGFWCDKEEDCDYGDDEKFCLTPQIQLPMLTRRVKVKLGAPAYLRCSAIGLPPARIVWRFNWDCLPKGFHSDCTCKKIGETYSTQCTLYTRRLSQDQVGIITCEAINNSGRAFSEDYHLVLF